MNRHLAPLSAMSALLLALSACTTSNGSAPEPMPAPPEMLPNCGMGMLGGYVGHQATADAVAGLREWRGDHKVRVLRPGQMVTMDYLPERLNIHVDESNVIRKFTCG